MITMKKRFPQRTRALTGTAILFIAFCAVLSLSARNAAAQERGPSQRAAMAIDGPARMTLPDPVYRIPLRVHVGKSGRSPGKFKVVLEEINDIWLTQAGICFEMQIVLDDATLDQGMDIWFLPVLSGGAGLNGYFRDEHDIRVRDTPILGPAANPARSSAARTAAHEFGHSLYLPHRQDSDDNLMRSKTFGWQLNGREVREARSAAAEKALQDTTLRKCTEPRIMTRQGSSDAASLPKNAPAR